MCKLCRMPSTPFATGTILGKYEIQYFRCPECGLVQTEEPYWLGEAYAQPINTTDLDVVGRSVAFARTCEVLISTLFDASGKFVDYGGGYGTFVRLMRDAGFDFRRHDKYCPNIFAQGFDVTPGDQSKIELITSFEVFEHLPEPGQELDQLLQRTSNVFFSTSLIALNDPPKPGDWWYYGLDHGQHITFYTRESFERFARRSGLYFYSTGILHLLTRRKIPKGVFRFLCDGRVSRLGELLLPNRPSLQEADVQHLMTRE